MILLSRVLNHQIETFITYNPKKKESSRIKMEKLSMEFSIEENRSPSLKHARSARNF